MIDSKHDVKKAARQMISRYGEAALQEIDLRILELEYHDYPDELELWRSIRRRVESMTADSSSESKH